MALGESVMFPVYQKHRREAVFLVYGEIQIRTGSLVRHYPAYKNGAFNLTELSRLCGISRTTAYKYIGLLEGKRCFHY